MLGKLEWGFSARVYFVTKSVHNVRVLLLEQINQLDAVLFGILALNTDGEMQERISLPIPEIAEGAFDFLHFRHAKAYGLHWSAVSEQITEGVVSTVIFRGG